MNNTFFPGSNGVHGRARPIVTEPDERLHTESVDVNKIDSEVCSLMEDMIVSMKQNNGIGLTAVQVGVLLNVIVVDVAAICKSDAVSRQAAPNVVFLRMANTRVLQIADEVEECTEGCLSYPGIDVPVTRAKWCEVEYIDNNSETKRLKAYGLLARCILHEVDHAKGIVLIDYLSRLKKQQAINFFRKRNKMITKANEHRF